MALKVTIKAPSMRSTLMTLMGGKGEAKEAFQPFQNTVETAALKELTNAS